MEKRKEYLSAFKVCRFCLVKNASLGNLYDRHQSNKNTVDLPLKILSCVSIEVFPSDKMPPYICSHCRFFMDLFYTFKQIVRQADEKILKYIQNGTALEAVPWSTKLIKAYQSSLDTDVKTVVEGGATVEISTHSLSESDDEDDENIFNVTIADGSDEESKGSTCIKVVTSKDNEDSKNMMTQTSKGFALSKQRRHLPPHRDDKPFACKHCSKRFSKSQHFTKHMRLKHRENTRSVRGPYGQTEHYRCEQCDDIFSTQDELIYHSAIHATQNLTCPLCQEKFENVDAVTAHIKSHVNGVEFMCDFCELVFTTKEKLEHHLVMAHEDEFNNELGQDESSMEMEPEEDDDDNSINVKDEGDHMLIEIKKADEYMLHNTAGDSEDKCDASNSDDSEMEVTYSELSTADTLEMMKKDIQTKSLEEKSIASFTATESSSETCSARNDQTPRVTQVESVIKKGAENKRKQVQQQSADTVIVKKEKCLRSERNSVGASNKSLQLLEKELQELKRTNNTRNDGNKTTAKPAEQAKGKRPQLHSSTPKIRSVEDKKTSAIIKMPISERKALERRAVTKENKEPKEIKETKAANISAKENKDTTPTPKSIVKNGSNERNSTEEGVRRSTRPCKIKDYAKMIRDRSHPDEDDETDDTDDEEYTAEKTPERTKRKSITKVQPKMIQTQLKISSQSRVIQATPTTPTTAPSPIPAPVATPTPRKRGRPRKEPPKGVPAKVKKDTSEETITTKKEEDSSVAKKELPVAKDKTDVEVKSNNTKEVLKQTSPEQPSASPELIVYPTGQTLKKVPVKSLPPGVKAMPLPMSARPLANRELCEMQIGKKMVKVQKIVMTKAEVEAMAKKGLVEMKDGTMVLKQGIKLPTSDPAIIKSTLVGETDMKESLQKKEKATPSRCDLSEDL